MEQASYLDSRIERIWAVEDTIEAYEQELNWKKEFDTLKAKFKIRKDPSEDFITARQLKEFHAWCPVSRLYLTSVMLNRFPFCNNIRSKKIRTYLFLPAQKTRSRV